MAPIRRYLRITRHSVLEVRIYLDNPALAPTWLLNSRDPVLPRVIEAVRPLVLPKLREENENAKRKGGKKKKGVRDVVEQEDFEVSIFLTETSSNHALLTKQKSFADKPRLKSNSSKLSNWLNTSDNPIDLDEDADVPQVLREEEGTSLQDIPEISEAAADRRRRKRHQSESDALFVRSDDEDAFQEQEAPPAKRRKRLTDTDETTEDDKKKLALSTAYEGFSIYGRVLCLIVKRKGVKKSNAGGPASGSQMLENWVSTQAAQEGVGDDGDDG